MLTCFDPEFDSDKDFRLVRDKIDGMYYIQKKRFFFGWRFLYKETTDGWSFAYEKILFKDHDKAKDKLKELRKKNRQYKIKRGRYIVLND